MKCSTIIARRVRSQINHARVPPAFGLEENVRLLTDLPPTIAPALGGGRGRGRGREKINTALPGGWRRSC